MLQPVFEGKFLEIVCGIVFNSKRVNPVLGFQRGELTIKNGGYSSNGLAHYHWGCPSHNVRTRAAARVRHDRPTRTAALTLLLLIDD